MIPQIIQVISVTEDGKPNLILDDRSNIWSLKTTGKYKKDEIKSWVLVELPPLLKL